MERIVLPLIWGRTVSSGETREGGKVIGGFIELAPHYLKLHRRSFNLFSPVYNLFLVNHPANKVSISLLSFFALYEMICYRQY